MSEPTDLERFIRYARVFELAQAAAAWSVLEPHLAEDVDHIVHDGGSLGGTDHGREAVIAGLRDSVNDHDRRFDVRIPEILEGPIQKPEGVWMRYALTLRSRGLPDLRIEGEHLTCFDADGRIRLIEEWLPPETPERVEQYLAEHGDALRPAGSPIETPDTQDLRDLEASGARSMIRAYGSAKSQQDIGAALAVCTPDFVLETPAFGLEATGQDEAASQLSVFFEVFPDYAVTLDGFAQGDAVSTWGRARLSFHGDFLGFPPTHKTADLEIFCLFDFEQGSIRRERFIFDRAEFCDQLGIPVADLTQTLDRIRSAQTHDRRDQPATTAAV